MDLAKIFLYLSLAMLAGVGIASLAAISPFLIKAIVLATVFVFLYGFFARKRNAIWAGILLAGFILGFLRFDSVWFAAQNNELAAFNGRSAQITGTIINDPVSSGQTRQLVVKPDNANGKILILAYPYPEYDYGDRIRFTAQLEAPKEFDSFDYKNYLAKDGIYSMARYPDLELVSTGSGNKFYAGLFWIKHKLMAGIGQVLPSPQNSLLIAILFGDQSGLSSCSTKDLEVDPDCQKIKEKLNISGLRHLAAVSGTHVTIMASIIAPFLVWLGWWRQRALWATLAFIWSFILMIGLPASAVRAGIMGSFVIVARIAGRPCDVLRLVSIAAAAMVWLNPMVLRFDIGFQLSFLAVLGMACFAGTVEEKIGFAIPRPEFLRQGLAVTLAAQIFTLPVLIFNFGYVSIYAPLSNILVEPFVPFITIYGFILAVSAAINFILGWLLFFPIWLALSHLIFIANVFSSLPGAAFNFRIGFWWLILAYAIIAAIAWRVRSKERSAFMK